jgi:hypothetical protein
MGVFSPEVRQTGRLIFPSATAEEPWLPQSRFDGAPGHVMDAPGTLTSMGIIFSPVEAFVGSLEAARLIRRALLQALSPQG